MAEIKSFNNNTRIQNWADMLSLSNPNRTPLLSTIVGNGQVGACGETTRNWVDYAVENTKTTLTAGIDSVTTTIPVADGSIFTNGMLIVVNDELIKISSISGNNLTVVRGQQGTTAAAALVGAIAFLVSDGKTEGATYSSGTYKKGAEYSNRMQIFTTPFEISGTARVQKATGASGKSLYQLEVEKKQKQHEAKIEKALMQGISFFDSGTGIRAMGGVRNFLKDGNSVAVGGTLSLTKINELLLKAYEQGAELDNGSYVIMLHPSVADSLAATFKDYILNNTNQSTQFGQSVQSVRTNYGIFPLVVTNNTKVSEAFLVDTSKLALLPLTGEGSRALELQEMGMIGDKEQWQFVSEVTLEVRDIHLQGILTGITLV